jgi:alkaline phosphatase
MAKTLRIALIVALAVALLLGVATGAAPQANAASGVNPYKGVKNVILFISDGAGAEHFELGRGLNGDWLYRDRIPWKGVGTLDTTSLDGVTDSAAAGTALATGCETHNHVLSMVPTDSGYKAVETVLERAMSNGKWAGLITDVAINDATPAAFAAHVTDRYSVEIAEQMQDQSIQILFGAKNAGPLTVRPLLNLPGVTYMESSQDLAPYFSGAKTWTVPMYGLMGGAALTYDLDRQQVGVVGVEPTLPEMTDAALRDLSRGKKGFFLMVEGGAIDWVAHDRDPGSVGAEVIEFDQAVKVAYDWAAKRGDTLIVVTSDHETGGLAVDGTTNYTAIAGQKATTEYTWGLLEAGEITIKQALIAYMGVLSPTAAEIDLVKNYGQMGISDVLAARDNVTWAWSGGDDGEHTLTPVPILAWGPGADRFNVTEIENEYVGTELMKAVSN